MKEFVLRVIFIFAMSLTSVNVCFAGDSVCTDETVAKSVHSENNTEENTEEDCQSDHCICSLSCSSVVTFSSAENKLLNTFIKSKSYFTYINIHYPEIFLSLEKPPII